MDMLLVVLFTILGLCLIIFCATWFIDASIWFAKKAKIPTLIIGATIVSVGTTLPELIVSYSSAIKARISGDTDFYAISVGNSVGSMICNILLILGVSMAFAPTVFKKGNLKSKIFFVFGVTGLLTLFVSTGNSLAIWESIILMVAFISFMVVNVMEAMKKDEEEENLEAKNFKWYVALILFIVGAVGIAFGANLLVDNAEKLALAIHIPPSVIAATIVAVGTSLPELVTTITAIRKRSVQLGVGNIIGANIINASLIVGGIGLISSHSLPIDDFTRSIALFFLIGATIIAMLPLLIKGKSYRWQGIVLLATFVGFMTANILYSIL